MATTMRISDGREALAEAMALRLSNECNRIVKVSEVLNFIFDRYLYIENEDQTVKAFIEKEKQKEGKKR